MSTPPLLGTMCTRPWGALPCKKKSQMRRVASLTRCRAETDRQTDNQLYRQTGKTYRETDQVKDGRPTDRYAYAQAGRQADIQTANTVSYTHLTLPTILLV